MPRLLSYIVIRALLALPTVFVLLTTVFFVMRILPGDAALALLGPSATDEQLQRFRQYLGLDRPLHVQYLAYLQNVATGNFGFTVGHDRTVGTAILTAIPATVEVAVAAMLFALLFGIGSGLLSARKGGITDKALRGFVLAGYSVPIFWVGLVFQIAFGLVLGVLPIAGRISRFAAPPTVTGLYVLDSLIAGNLVDFVDALAHLTLPALTLGIWLAAPMSGMTRTNLLKALNEDYVVTARAMGLPENTVVYKYAFRNALLPVMALLGLQASGLLGGSVLVENVFAIPGLGNLLITAVYQRDFNLIQAILAYLSLIVVFLNLLVDVAYALVDPRVTL